jgi:hypothetical protein
VSRYIAHFRLAPSSPGACPGSGAWPARFSRRRTSREPGRDMVSERLPSPCLRPTRRRRVGCGSLWPPGVGRGTHGPSGVDPRGAPRRMTRFWVKTWVEPGGGRPNNTTNRRSHGAFYIYRSKRPAGFISGYFRCTRPAGQANSTDAEARRVQPRSHHNTPRDARFPATPWEPEGCAAISRALRPRPGSGSYATIGST